MKVKYNGESFYAGFGLTNSKIYKCLGVEQGMLRIEDDEGDDYLYPADLKWEIVEDKNGELEKALKENAKG